MQSRSGKCRPQSSAIGDERDFGDRVGAIAFVISAGENRDIAKATIRVWSVSSR
jgi:hypothetical protein